MKTTTSRCPQCHRAIEARVVRRGNTVWMDKECPTHGRTEVEIARNARFYHLARGEERCGKGCGPGEGAGERTEHFERLSTCIALIEIVEGCNLSCPTCYADSPLQQGHEIDCLTFEDYVQRVEGVIRRKGSLDILQLSGGEPTIHPEFFRILDWSLGHGGIGYVLVNTNGVRIAREEAFRRKLATSRKRFGKLELYLQFDGPQAGGQRELRGADLRGIREEALDLAGELGVPTTLAMVVTANSIGHLGDTMRFGLERPHCRGVTFQPVFSSGRVPASLSEAPEVISVGDVVKGLVEQSRGLLDTGDFTPLPCGDPNCHTIGYLLRTADGPVGLGSLTDLNALQGFLRDRVDYRLDDLLGCGCESEPMGQVLKGVEIGPDQPFRLFIKPFMDAWTFDQDRIDRCCTHVIRPDGKLDSFCRYYLERSAQARSTQAVP